MKFPNTSTLGTGNAAKLKHVWKNEDEDDDDSDDDDVDDDDDGDDDDDDDDDSDDSDDCDGVMDGSGEISSRPKTAEEYYTLEN